MRRSGDNDVKKTHIYWLARLDIPSKKNPSPSDYAGTRHEGSTNRSLWTQWVSKTHGRPAGMSRLVTLSLSLSTHKKDPFCPTPKAVRSGVTYVRGVGRENVYGDEANRVLRVCVQTHTVVTSVSQWKWPNNCSPLDLCLHVFFSHSFAPWAKRRD